MPQMLLAVSLLGSLVLGWMLVAAGATVGSVPVRDLVEAFPGPGALAAFALAVGLGLLCGLRVTKEVKAGGRRWGRILVRSTAWGYVLGLLLSLMLQVIFMQMYGAAVDSHVLHVTADLPIPQPGFVISDWLAILGLLLGPLLTAVAWKRP